MIILLVKKLSDRQIMSKKKIKKERQKCEGHITAGARLIGIKQRIC
jgi:hypothetical protein